MSETVESTTKNSVRVGIIGGGPTGLIFSAALKNYRHPHDAQEEGDAAVFDDITIFEANDQVGGVWSYYGNHNQTDNTLHDALGKNCPMYDGLHTNLPSAVMEIPGFEFQATSDTAGKKVTTVVIGPEDAELSSSRNTGFPSASEVLTYLQDYTKSEGIDGTTTTSPVHILTSCKVESVQRVRVEDEKSSKHRGSADAVKQCTTRQRNGWLTRLSTLAPEEKRGRLVWKLRVTKRFNTNASESSPNVLDEVSSFHYFDYLVVANGHYQVPNIPKEFESLFEQQQRDAREHAALPHSQKESDVASTEDVPSSTFSWINPLTWGGSNAKPLILHGINYKSPKQIQSLLGKSGKSVLVVGGGPSGRDFVAELVAFFHDCGTATTERKTNDITAPSIHWCLRNGAADDDAHKNIPTDFVNTIHSEIERYDEEQRKVVFMDDGVGSKHFDIIILATGYLYDFPFFPNMSDENGSNAPQSVHYACDRRVIKGLYKHLFAIHEGPTLVFPTLNWKIAPFPVAFEQAQVVASVWGSIQNGLERDYERCWERFVQTNDDQSPEDHIHRQHPAQGIHHSGLPSTEIQIQEESTAFNALADSEKHKYLALGSKQWDYMDELSKLRESIDETLWMEEEMLQQRDKILFEDITDPSVKCEVTKRCEKTAAEGRQRLIAKELYAKTSKIRKELPFGTYQDTVFSV